jgi:hypothetical protein
VKLAGAINRNVVAPDNVSRVNVKGIKRSGAGADIDEIARNCGFDENSAAGVIRPSEGDRRCIFGKERLHEKKDQETKYRDRNIPFTTHDNTFDELMIFAVYTAYEK